MGIEIFDNILGWPDAAGVDHLPLRIRLFRNAYARAADDALAQIGTTVSRYVVLLMIETHPGLAGSRLAELTLQKPQSLSGITAALEKQSLIERRLGHGRAITHHLTPAGHDLVKRSRTMLLELNQQVFQGFEPDRIKRLVSDIQELTDNLVSLANEAQVAAPLVDTAQASLQP